MFIIQEIRNEGRPRTLDVALNPGKAHSLFKSIVKPYEKGENRTKLVRIQMLGVGKHADKRKGHEGETRKVKDYTFGRVY